MYCSSCERDALTAQIETLKLEVQRLKNLLLTDVLTGIPNEKHLIQQFEVLCAQYKRTARSMAMAFIDIDKFKSINDTHGHAKGDEIIQIVATTMRKVVRAEDFVARIHGDEFCILLPGIGEKAACDLMDRVRVKVGERLSQSLGSPITLSIGIVFYQEGDTFDGLKKRADEQMYRSKRGGRNRISMHV